MKTKQDILQELHEYNIYIEKRELFLYPPQVEVNGELDIVLAMGLLKNIRFLESINKNDIIIHQYSYGGEWDASMAIYDAIKSSECHISMVCHGAVQSTGAVVLQAADLRLAMPNCQFMFHEGSSGIHQDLTHRQMKSYSISEQQKENILYEIFTDHCINGKFFKENNKKRSLVKAYLKTQIGKKEDWLLSSEEAFNYGFIDLIVGSKECPNLNNLK